MNTKKEKLLNDTYYKWIQTVLYDLPLDGANDFVDPEIMGYGTAIDEKVLSISDYREMVNRQREQAVGLEMSFEITPVFRSISNKEDSAIFVDEIKVSIIFEGGKQELFLRLTTILEYINSKWIVVHLHGSMPTETTAEADTWLVNEWQRKNEQLQKLVDEKTSELLNKNRELEIETALEKVRTIAMGMLEREDMLDVCRIISDQLQFLGVIEIRNVQTALFYETKKTYINFEYYPKHNKSLITEVDYRTHELQELFANKMIKGVEELFSETLRNKEVKDWYEYQKTTNQFADTFLETAESLSYYWYSLGPVALGMSTYIPLNEQEINLFKRFRNVFELAYRRFMDIEKAQAQAREAKIEASLERVRAVAMSMMKSDELLKVCESVFNELRLQGFTETELRNTQIVINNDEREIYKGYQYSDYTGGEIAEVPYDMHPVIRMLNDKLRQSKDAFADIEISGTAMEDWKNFVKSFPQKPDDKLNAATELHYYFYSVGIGALGLSSFKSLPEEKLKILQRLRNVFNLSYQRYTDIALAEAQAREAQIELALERVRARTMAMQHSEELAETAYVLFQQFKELDKAPKMITIGIMKEEESVIEFWVTDWSGGGAKVNRKFNASIDEPVLLNKIFTAWKEKKKSITIELAGKELQDWINYRVKLSGIPDDNDYSYSHGIVIVGFFSKGILSMSTYESVSSETSLLIERFAGVFEQTYTRFLDLQKAEAQAREAQIETALERVRSRSMGMQKSEELKDVIKVVYEQFVHLKINVDHAGFVVDYTPKGDWHFWIADEQDIPSKITHPYFESVWAHQFNEAKENGLDFFATNLNFEEKNKFYNELLSYVHGLPKASKDFYLSCPGLAASTVLFDNVSLYIENFSGIPYTDDENNILMRFGKVFQQTYTRFLDLKRAEAQGREAQIETALEKVRSRSLAMHKAEELGEVVTVVVEKLRELDIPVNDGVAIVTHIEGSKDQIEWMENLGFPSAMKFYQTYFEHPILADYWKAKNEGLDFIAPRYTAEESQSFLNHIFEFSDYKNTPQKVKDYCLAASTYSYSAAFQKNSSIFINDYSGRSLTEQEIDIVKRFSKVFEQAYIRFLDLQRAEAQAREAKIETALERVRSRTMGMQRSDELAETVSVLFKQLLDLGVKSTQLRTCGIVTFKENEPKGEVWITDITGEIIDKAFIAPYDEAPAYKMIYFKWKKGEKFLEINLKGDDFLEHLTYVKKYSAVPNINLDEIQKSYSEIFFHVLFFSAGYLFIISYEPLPEYHEIFKRFGSVFQQTYTRFLDFKNAEARAREAMMQASLDRLRAEIASMRNAEDLQRITPLIWHELLTLDVPFIRCGVFIVDDEQEKVHVYLSTPDGKSLGVLNLSFDANELTSNTVDHWRKKLVYTEHWNKEQFINWSQSMIKLGQIQNPETYQGSAIPPESLNLHFIPFAQGMLYVGNTAPLTDEKIHLVKSLADAFSIAYTRYEDFRNLEYAKNKVEATLSELKSAQAQLIQAEKLASLGQLTAGIAHEIKNPLNFVNNFSEISNELIDEMKLEMQNNNKEEAMAIADDIKQNLEKINQHGKRADSIVKGMLLHSRGSAGEKSLTNINDLLDQYVNLAYHGLRAQDKEFNITIQKDFDETLEKINVVPQDISRVFLNIVNNGFYAANEKKKKSGNDFAPILKVSTKNLPDKVEIRIRDNGNGIPQSIKKNIFNPFFTTKPTGEGTGLGLSLSYDIITKVHNGEIIFETKENKFTEFTITIPKS